MDRRFDARQVGQVALERTGRREYRWVALAACDDGSAARAACSCAGHRPDPWQVTFVAAHRFSEATDALMSRLARIDRLTSGDVRQAFLFSVARDFVHALPEGPLDLDLPAGAAIVGAMCHRLACDRRSAPDDGVDAFVRIYRERVARLDRDVDVVAKMFASLVSPKRIIDYLDRHRFE